MPPLDLLLHPAALALLGLVIGSFLNVVVHRLPLMLERQWWGDVAAQLADGASFRRVFGADAPAGLAQAGGALEKSLGALQPLGLARPASRCPSCGHRIRWYENIPVLSWLVLKGRCSACKTPHRRPLPAGRARNGRCCSPPSAGGSARSRPRCCGAASSPCCWRWR